MLCWEINIVLSILLTIWLQLPVRYKFFQIRLHLLQMVLTPGLGRERYTGLSPLPWHTSLISFTMMDRSLICVPQESANMSRFSWAILLLGYWDRVWADIRVWKSKPFYLYMYVCIIRESMQRTWVFFRTSTLFYKNIISFI